MLISPELLLQRGRLDSRIEFCRYMAVESVFTVEKAHLGKDWKTVRKCNRGRRGGKMEVANFGQNANKVSKNTGKHFKGT